MNKNSKLEEINSPLVKILRNLIDGPIDTDKGDYLLRDSYHCGVVYGIYDINRLWRNIVIADDWSIGVSEKGALEAWNLRLARYKMFKNVYKHHIRNITDAILIDIVAQSFNKIRNKNKIFPVTNKSSLNEDELVKFTFWTDTELLKNLNELDDEIRSKIEIFMKRKLPKRFLSFPLEEIGIFTKDREHILKIKEIINNISKKKNIQLYFHILKELLPPVFTKDVQENIKVVTKREEMSLAEYFKFNIQDKRDDLERYIEESYVMEIFAEENTSEEIKDIIKKQLLEINS